MTTHRLHVAVRAPMKAYPWEGADEMPFESAPRVQVAVVRVSSHRDRRGKRYVGIHGNQAHIIALAASNPARLASAIAAALKNERPS